MFQNFNTVIQETVWLGKLFFFIQKRLDPRVWGANSLPLNGNRGSFLRLKRLGREFNHLPSSSTAVTNEWSYTSIPSPVCVHGVKRENYFFYFTCYVSLQSSNKRFPFRPKLKSRNFKDALNRCPM